MRKLRIEVPAYVAHVLDVLGAAGYQAFLVGGCVRDALLGLRPLDWDVATDAVPETVSSLFGATTAVGAVFGTVVVHAPEPVEVTTFRREHGYADGRHPSAVSFARSIGDDLSRRDFTINAMAWDPATGLLIDPMGGASDLEQRVIRTVGDAAQRFREDALRLLRAVRFACQVDCDMAPDTWAAAGVLSHLVDGLSRERVRDELLRILVAPDPGRGLWMLSELGILVRVLLELRGSDRLRQGKSGAPTLLDHLIQTAAACPGDAVLRLTGLLHDVGKLTTRALTKEGRVTFHGHEAESARLAEAALRRLRFDGRSISRAVSLINQHMMHCTISQKAMRRFVSEHGEQWVRDLLALREADHVASGGTPGPWFEAAKAELAQLLAAEGALHRSDLAINGHDVMDVLGVAPGPLVGHVLRGLFAMVLDNPSLNQRERLLPHIRDLAASFPAGWQP